MDSFEKICGVNSLVDLKMGKNNLEGSLSSMLENLNHLEVLELHENKLTTLPESIKSLGRLRSLNVSHNQLEAIDFTGLHDCPLTELNIASNRIRGTLVAASVGELSSLQLLDMRGNRISNLSEGPLSLPSLQTFLGSNNEMEALPDMSSWIELLTFITDYNRLTVIPSGCTGLKKLRVMDFTGNNITTIEPSLGNMETLEVIKFEGNPIRERNLLGMSIADLKRTLRNRIGPAPVIQDGEFIAPAEEEEEIQGEVIELRPGGVLDLSKREMDVLPREILENVTPAPLAIEAHHNLLTTIPSSVEMFMASLTILNLSHNKLSTDTYMTVKMTLRWLNTLSLANNTITSIRPLLDNLDAPKLEQLDISINRIKDITGLRPKFPNLARLYARDNVIEDIPVESVDGLRILDLSGNSIATLPPKLGLVMTLRELRVEGNCFRVPGWRVLQKGTEAVLMVGCPEFSSVSSSSSASSESSLSTSSSSSVILKVLLNRTPADSVGPQWLRDKLPQDDAATEDGFVSARED